MGLKNRGEHPGRVNAYLDKLIASESKNLSKLQLAAQVINN